MALLEILSDLGMAADSREFSVLILLDLTLAFNTVGDRLKDFMMF